MNVSNELSLGSGEAVASKDVFFSSGTRPGRLWNTSKSGQVHYKLHKTSAKHFRERRTIGILVAGESV